MNIPADKFSPPILARYWKEQSKAWGHPFHPMCSYMAMFPPRLPHYFIARFSNPGDRVLDPFSGRGTTPAQACVEGRIGIASDLNPLAYALSRAKISAPDRDAVLARVARLGQQWSPDSRHKGEPDRIRMLFHAYTLDQLVYLKQVLGESAEDVFIRATILGILHGKYRRRGADSMYLSIDMPNTFSMSPNYIRRYVKDKGIKKLRLDVFEKVHQRIVHLYREGPPATRGEAHQLDVRRLGDVIEAESIQLVFSSPPYLKVVKYGLYNWIRLWFLGEESERVDRTLDDAHELEAYLTFMDESVAAVENLLKPGGVCALVIGDVAKNDNRPVNLAEKVWEKIAGRTKLQRLAMVTDKIAGHAKVTKIWGQTRGRATSTDRILVLCNGAGPAVDHRIVKWD